MSPINIFFLFLYYGSLCFSGGSSLVPIYINDLVHARHFLTLEEFGNFAAISQLTPGPIGINLATFLGFKEAGILGALAATIGLLFAPYFLMTIAMRLLQKWENNKYVQGLLEGIKYATVGMIIAALILYLQMSVFSENIPWAALFNPKIPIPDSFVLNPYALIIFGASTFVLHKTKISIIVVIISSAIIGGLVPLLQLIK